MPVLRGYVVQDLDEMLVLMANQRKSDRLTLRAVVARMGTTNSSGASVCQWEHGVARPRADLLFAWADALGLDISLIPRPTSGRAS
jgi:transcriptional regulator with XRE-family HTH domain